MGQNTREEKLQDMVNEVDVDDLSGDDVKLLWRRHIIATKIHRVLRFGQKKYSAISLSWQTTLKMATCCNNAATFNAQY